jgi:hypothetical protein
MIIRNPETFMKKIVVFMVNHVVEGPDIFLQKNYPKLRRNGMILCLIIPLDLFIQSLRNLTWG